MPKPRIIPFDRHARLQAWEDFPEDSILSGTRRQSGLLLFEDKLRGLSAGVWEQGANESGWMDYPVNEFMMVLEGEVVIGTGPQGVRIHAPEHRDAADAQAFAYVRPHDFEVQRYQAGASGLVARLSRAIVVGPIARLELLRDETTQAGGAAVIEAQIPAQQFREMGLRDGETLLVSPRKARVFLQGH